MRIAQQTTQSGSFPTTVNLVKNNFKRGLELEEIAYQKGIRSTIAWPSRKQVLRIIPGYDANGVYPQVNAGRPFVSDYDPADYLTDTFIMVNTIAGFGASKYNVISDYKPGSPEAVQFGGNTVLSCFAEDVCRAVYAVVKGKRPFMQPGPQWASWALYDPATKVRPILSRPRSTLLFQALVWILNGDGLKNGDGTYVKGANGEPLPMIYVFGLDNTKSISELFDALITPRDRTKPIDPINNSNYYGIGEQNGSILYMLPKPYTLPTGKSASYLMPHIAEDETKWEPARFPLSDQQIHSWWHPWNDLLNYMTPEEQCRLVANEFGADTLNYVIANDRRLQGVSVPQDIASKGLGRYSTANVQPQMVQPSLMGGLGFGAPKQEAPVNVARVQPEEHTAAVTFGLPQSSQASAEPSKPATILSSQTPEMRQALASILKNSAPVSEDTAIAKELEDYGDMTVFEPLE